LPLTRKHRTTRQWQRLSREIALAASLDYFSESDAMAGADNAMNKHMMSLLSFDKNKGFTLESGQFVPSCKMHQVSYRRST
jgi:hypothetical protein